MYWLPPVCQNWWCGRRRQSLLLVHGKRQRIDPRDLAVGEKIERAGNIERADKVAPDFCGVFRKLQQVRPVDPSVCETEPAPAGESADDVLLTLAAGIHSYVKIASSTE